MAPSFSIILRLAVAAAAGVGLFAPAAESEQAKAPLAQTYSPDTDEDVIAYGKYLFGECAICHSQPGDGHATPDIKHLSMTQFFQAMTDFRSGERTNNTMVSAATALDIDQITALATYFEHVHNAEADQAKTGQ